MIDKLILEHTQKHYIDENKLIERSLINYYSLRKKKDKSHKETFYQDELYSQVLELFELMSHKIGHELEIDEGKVYDSLKRIHIKT